MDYHKSPVIGNKQSHIVQEQGFLRFNGLFAFKFSGLKVPGHIDFSYLMFGIQVFIYIYSGRSVHIVLSS